MCADVWSIVNENAWHSQISHDDFFLERGSIFKPERFEIGRRTCTCAHILPTLSSLASTLHRFFSRNSQFKRTKQSIKQTMICEILIFRKPRNCRKLAVSFWCKIHFTCYENTGILEKYTYPLRVPGRITAQSRPMQRLTDCEQRRRSEEKLEHLMQHFAKYLEIGLIILRFSSGGTLSSWVFIITPPSFVLT